MTVTKSYDRVDRYLHKRNEIAFSKSSQTEAGAQDSGACLFLIYLHKSFLVNLAITVIYFYKVFAKCFNMKRGGLFRDGMIGHF